VWTTVGPAIKRAGTDLALVAVIALVGFGVVGLVGFLQGHHGEARLNGADVPPLEYAYLDPRRVAAYLGQDENGLARIEERTEQINRSLKAGVSFTGGPSAEASGETQHKTTATVEPNAADHFYTFLRLLREHEADYTKPSTCNTYRRTQWLGEVDDQAPADKIMKEIACVGAGDFVRVHNAQLFLPSFAQALPLVQSADAFYGALPARRSSFTSPTQLPSAPFAATLKHYVNDVGKNPRMPFLAAPYGEESRVGANVGMFLPAEYRGLTTEPSLFSGSVTIVAKVVYYATAGAPYIDYPTVATFGRALLKAPAAFRTDLGVCSELPPVRTLPSAVKEPAKHNATGCTGNQRMIYEVKKAVRLKPPFVVLLPLAIYD
jgi:hypothetical protein